jgi:predicted Zn finger-like uncharacterized protein
MILNCSSCGKKFVVADQAITANGRLVQCGACGNKWKQFPIKNETKTAQSETGEQKIITQTRQIKQLQKKTKKIKKSTTRKSRGIDLYSPEYLAKKHGIRLSENPKIAPSGEKVSFGFYNSLLLFLLIIVILSRGLYFFQDFVVQRLPFTEFYIDYFFESIKNMFEIWKNLISDY